MKTWELLEPRERWFLLGIFVLSLGLRIWYLYEMNQTLFLTQLRLDELFHFSWAKSIAAGNILGDQIFFRAPLYAYWLGLNFAVFGQSYIIPRIIQHILGSFTVILLYLLARKISSKKVAIISTVLFALYPPIIYNEDKLLFESILIPQVIFFFLVIYSAKEKPTFLKWLSLGLLFGFICITRPIFLPLLFILGLTIYIWYRKIFQFKKYVWWMCALVFGTFLIIIPVTLRNYFIGNDFVLIASQGGINFYIGNNSTADGLTSAMPGLIGNRWENRDIKYPVMKELGRSPTASEVDQYWQKLAIDFIVNHPAQFISLTLKKLSLFWNYIEIPNNSSFYLYEQFSTTLKILPISFGIIAPLSLLGIWIALKEKRGRLLIVFIFCYTGTIILFFVCDRFRLPVIPFLCIFNGLSIVKMWELLWNRSKREIGRGLFLLTIFCFVVWGNFYDIQKENPPANLFQLGNLELSSGNYSSAKSYYEQLFKTKTIIQNAHLNYGVAELKLDNIKNAVDHFQSELSYFPQSYEALVNLAHIYLIAGRPDLTLHYSRKAVDIKPYAANAYIDLTFALSDMKRYDEADSTLRNFIDNYNGEGLYEKSVLAGIHLMQGKLDIAEKEYILILKSIKLQTQPEYEPEFQYSKEYGIGGSWSEFKAKVEYSLGHINLLRNKLDSALTHFQNAITIFQNFSDGWISLGTTLYAMNRLREADSAFSTGLKITPNNPKGWYSYGLLMKQMSRIPDAIAAFQKALSYNPDFEEVRDELKKITTVKQE